MAARSPSPVLVVPGSWPDADVDNSEPQIESSSPQHIDRVLSFHQRLSLSLSSSSSSLSRVPLLPLTNPPFSPSYSMPGSLFPSDDSQLTRLGVHDTSASLAETSLSTTYTSDSAPDVPTQGRPVPFSKPPVPLLTHSQKMAYTPNPDNAKTSADSSPTSENFTPPPPRRSRPRILIPELSSTTPSPSAHASTANTSPASPGPIVFASPTSSNLALPSSPPLTPYSSYSRSPSLSYGGSCEESPSPAARTVLYGWRTMHSHARSDTELSPRAPPALPFSSPLLHRSNTNTDVLPTPLLRAARKTNTSFLASPVARDTGTNTSTLPAPSPPSVSPLLSRAASSSALNSDVRSAAATSAAEYAAAFRAAHPTADVDTPALSNRHPVPSTELVSPTLENVDTAATAGTHTFPLNFPSRKKTGIVRKVKRLGDRMRRVFGAFGKSDARRARSDGVNVEVTNTTSCDSDRVHVPAARKLQSRRPLTLYTFASSSSRRDTHVHTQTQKQFAPVKASLTLDTREETLTSNRASSLPDPPLPSPLEFLEPSPQEPTAPVSISDEERDIVSLNLPALHAEITPDPPSVFRLMGEENVTLRNRNSLRVVPEAGVEVKRKRRFSLSSVTNMGPSWGIFGV